MIGFIFKDEESGKYHRYYKNNVMSDWSLTDDPREAYFVRDYDAARLCQTGIQLTRGIAHRIDEVVNATICQIVITVTPFEGNNHG